MTPEELKAEMDVAAAKHRELKRAWRVSQGLVQSDEQRKEAKRLRNKAYREAHRAELIEKKRAIADMKGRPTADERLRSAAASRRYYAKHRDKILEKAWLKRKHMTPEEEERRRENNRDAAKRYRAYVKVRDNIR